jgi:D-inositol-3-phosphate glycosyltransferase
MDTGGMSVYIRELTRELGRRGHQVDIFTRVPESGVQHSIDLHERVRLIHLRAGTNGHVHKLAIYPYLAEFFRELESFRMKEGLCYDFIHSHYWLSGRVGKWAGDRWGIPHIVTFHTLGAVKNALVEAEQEPELRIATEKYLVKTCDRILVATRGEKEQLSRLYGASSHMIGVVPCGVNLNLFRPMDRDLARERLGYPHDESILLYVGRFAPVKGIDRLLEAFSCLQNGQRLRLVIVGGDDDGSPESQNLRGLVAKLNVEDSVSFVGRVRQEDLPPYYSAADLLVVPSHYESFGLVALEALASGTPVVATRVGAMESILWEGETGHVLKNGSASSLAKGIETFISGPKVASAHATRASVLKFGWENVASAMIDEYRSAINRHRVISATCSGSPSVSLTNPGWHPSACANTGKCRGST